MMMAHLNLSYDNKLCWGKTQLKIYITQYIYFSAPFLAYDVVSTAVASVH